MYFSRYNNSVNDPNSQPTSGFEEIDRAKKYRWVNIVFFVAIIAAFLIYSVVTSANRPISAAMDNTILVISTVESEDIVVNLADITSVEIKEPINDWDVGTLQSGTEDSDYCSGVYRNATYQSYQLYVNLSVDSYLVVQYTDGDNESVLVFNNNTNQVTKSTYDELTEYLEA